jgi:hypothetical protein
VEVCEYWTTVPNKTRKGTGMNLENVRDMIWYIGDDVFSRFVKILWYPPAESGYQNILTPMCDCLYNRLQTSIRHQRWLG